MFSPEEFKINDVALSWKDKGDDVDVLTLVLTYPLGRIYPGTRIKFIQKMNGKELMFIECMQF